MTDDSMKSRKKWIRPLPERLVNKIAAGEVIERPAAVLKELVENSLDAGATRIEIIIEKSGTSLISVIDNGCGIEADQLEVAFSRHATSKIRDFDDLENLLSFGFRGEALPSIGSVSRMRMLSCAEGADSGMEIIIEGGVTKSVKPAAAKRGTIVEVRDIFFNTPARRKFLKTEITEGRHLTRNAVALALSAPEVGFNYTINGKQLFTVEGGPVDIKSRAERLLLGGAESTGKRELFEVISESEILNVLAYLSPPETARQNQNGLYVFINNRFIKSQTLIHAVKAGYGELLSKGNYPVGALFLSVNPKKVDVNVHPTKAEVRLSEERQVHDILYQAIKRTIRGTDSIRRVDLETGEIRENNSIPAAEAIERIKHFRPNKIKFGETEKPARLPAQEMLDNLFGERVKRQLHEGDQIPGEEFLPVTRIKTESGIIPQDIQYLNYLGRISGLYLLFAERDQLLIVDQHAAHERILYEEIVANFNHGSAVSQNLLFPVNVELPPARRALFDESSEALKTVGFVAESFGGNTIMLSAVPALLAKKSPEKSFLLILEDVENLQKTGYDLKKAMAQSMACRAAIMAGDRLNENEALALFKQLINCDNRHCCPHGRPTILKISKDELDVKFGRK